MRRDSERGEKLLNADEQFFSGCPGPRTWFRCSPGARRSRRRRTGRAGTRSRRLREPRRPRRDDLSGARPSATPSCCRNWPNACRVTRSCTVPFGCTLGLLSKPVMRVSRAWCLGRTTALSSSEPRWSPPSRHGCRHSRHRRASPGSARPPGPLLGTCSGLRVFSYPTVRMAAWGCGCRPWGAARAESSSFVVGGELLGVDPGPCSRSRCGGRECTVAVRRPRSGARGPRSSR